jgi:conserved hypothetical protein TIGR00255
MPRQLLHLEDLLKKTIQQHISRGRVDCYITLGGSGAMTRKIHIDWDLMDEYYQLIRRIRERYGIEDSTRIGHLIFNENLISVEETDEGDDLLQKTVLDAVEEAARQLCDMRLAEGKELQKRLSGFLQEFSRCRERVRGYAPHAEKRLEERLRKKLGELLGDTFDENRILMEAAIYADRTDITEELDRLESHEKQFLEFLTQDDPVGRKLDFLIQEMNRETNTIGSKANDANIAQLVIEMKSLLEKMREQVQNIE